jgi:hypothetical protein
MNQKIELAFRSFATVFALVGLASCNLYSGLSSVGTDQGRVEEALKCLHDGDYECAIAQYTALENTDERNRRLCQVQLARAGLTLPVLINQLGSGTEESSSLGDLAQAILPWTQEKQTAVEAAAVPCDAYFAAAPTSELAQVLSTLSGAMDCAVRLAKTDTLVASSDTDTVCTTPGNKSGTITADDVSDNADGSITAVGMCTTDATACKTRIAATSGAGGGDENLDSLVGQLTGLTGASTGTAIRSILRTKVAP